MLMILISYLCILIYTSGMDLSGDTVGVAYTHTMCSDTHSVGVTQDGGRSLSAVASTAAHELGHNFNMAHDGSLVHMFVIHN